MLTFSIDNHLLITIYVCLDVYDFVTKKKYFQVKMLPFMRTHFHSLPQNNVGSTLQVLPNSIPNHESRPMISY